ncbi:MULTISPECIES: hypothetical protein [Aeromonas]|jgi:hypothetical protein|nr:MULTISPECIES: hypothetical protein [Aeromonas]MBP9660337.1 hypothetical protein [Aeromonas sp.]AXB04468.2 hypothetical protein C1C91_05145 [Aeromonas caviae]MBL0437279.1 hypothetical protein [Aeromonas caviae]MBL0485574.1 hypothetical protein [Aeromonas caviae]MBL0499214.1 hypothetical protein [Aeromonas caviae]
MNRTTALLLSLFLITGSALAQDEGSQTFSVDALTFNLDWNDTQFDWSQSNCFDLGSGDTAAADCKRINLNLEDETQRNQPPSTNQISTQPDQ